MKDILLNLIAYLFLILGLVSMLLPIPGGILLLGGSLTMLICVNPKAQFYLKSMRTNVSLINKLFFLIENKIGTRIKVMGVALEKTRPSDKVNDKDT